MSPIDRTRSRMHFTPEGWIYLVILIFVTVGAILRNVNLLIVMSGMMFAPLLLSWRIGTHVVRNARARRVVPTRIHVGQLTHFQWVFSNFSRLPVWSFVIQDEVACVECPQNPAARKRPRQRTQVTFNYIAAGQTEYISYQCLFMDRGIYEVGPASVATRFPFGLIKSWFRLPQKEPFFVAPRLGQLHPSWEKRIASHVIGAESIRRRRGAEEDEFYALRPWRAGDSRRQIHWRTTAKRGELMVKQFDQKTHRDVAVVLDLYVADGDALEAIAQQIERCESALSFGATLLTRMGVDCQGKIGLAIAGDRLAVEADRLNPEFVNVLMRQLASARGAARLDTITAIDQLADRVAPGTPIFVISTRPFPQADLEAQFDSRRWSTLRSWLHWVEVGSPAFERVFVPDDSGEEPALQILESEVNRASA